MTAQKMTKVSLEDNKVSVKVKLATLWASFMFLYIYVDYFTLYMPNKIANILQGKVFVFDISQTFILVALGLSTIPMLMIFLSVVLPAKVNRWTNMIVAILHIPYMLFNLSGTVWVHMVFAAVIEVLLLGVIIVYAWKWPHVDEK